MYMYHHLQCVEDEKTPSKERCNGVNSQESKDPRQSSEREKYHNGFHKLPSILTIKCSLSVPFTIAAVVACNIITCIQNVIGDSHNFDDIHLQISVRFFCMLQTFTQVYFPQGNDYDNCIHLSNVIKGTQ